MKRIGLASRASAVIRRAGGLLVMAAVATTALGWDGMALAHVPSAPTNGIESRLVALLHADEVSNKASASKRHARTTPIVSLPDEGALPSFGGADDWLNSRALTNGGLRGKVVVVNFWTYSCINCLRTLPYVKAWQSRYGPDGLVVIGVHTPEFGFEHDAGNIKRAAGDLGIRYPIAIDSDFRIWTAFDNQYWPAIYIADAQGRIRYHHFGEGDEDATEDVIRQLLAQRNSAMPASGHARIEAAGALAAADRDDIASGETYLGYRQATGFASTEEVKRDAAAAYSVPSRLSLNTWALGGTWKIGAEGAMTGAPHAQIAYRFHARDLHLVLAPPANGKAVRFRIAIDGRSPGPAHGSDTTADGDGIVNAARLYQLVRQQGPVQDHTFTIEFFDPDVRAYSFTFG